MLHSDSLLSILNRISRLIIDIHNMINFFHKIASIFLICLNLIMDMIFQQYSQTNTQIKSIIIRIYSYNYVLYLCISLYTRIKRFVNEIKQIFLFQEKISARASTRTPDGAS